MMASAKLLDNYLSVILPLAVDPLGIFIMRQYITSIPKEYEESAKIDGCSDFNIIWKIILPLSKPAIVVLIVTEFINTWNNFIYPLIMFYRSEMQTITTGIANFSYATLNVNWGATMAASIIGALVPMSLLAFLSKRIIEGFMLGGIKG
jgi:multiple sugar transport system permease protein